MFSKNSILPLSLLLCIVIFSNCKKDSNTPPDDTPLPQAEYYFSADLDDQILLYEIDGTGNFTMVNTNSSSNIPKSICSYTYGCSMGPAAPDDAPAIDVRFPDLFSGPCANVSSAFSGLFHTGLYGYGYETGNVLISYWDGTETWTSFPSLQENAIFEITGSERIETDFGVYQKVTGTASCLLFNLEGGSKKLENAKFVLSFGQF